LKKEKEQKHIETLIHEEVYLNLILRPSIVYKKGLFHPKSEWRSRHEYMYLPLRHLERLDASLCSYGIGENGIIAFGDENNLILKSMVEIAYVDDKKLYLDDSFDIVYFKEPYFDSTVVFKVPKKDDQSEFKNVFLASEESEFIKIIKEKKELLESLLKD